MFHKMKVGWDLTEMVTLGSLWSDLCHCASLERGSLPKFSRQLAWWWRWSAGVFQSFFFPPPACCDSLKKRETRMESIFGRFLPTTYAVQVNCIEPSKYTLVLSIEVMIIGMCCKMLQWQLESCPDSAPGCRGPGWIGSPQAEDAHCPLSVAIKCYNIQCNERRTAPNTDWGRGPLSRKCNARKPGSQEGMLLFSIVSFHPSWRFQFNAKYVSGEINI